MALPARDYRFSRRSWLLAGLGIGVSRLRAADSLAVSFDGDNLRVTAPGLHFLVGKPLQRLKDAATVTYFSQLTLLSDAQGTVFKRSPIERLVVSYDLWQEKFSVTIPGGGKRHIPNVTAQEAEAWCLENLAISAMGLPPERPFWLRFDLHTTGRRDFGNLVGDGLSLLGLVDILSRKPGAGDLSWMRRDGPFRLLDLPRTPSGRGRIG
jgi:hypothetical protein